MQHWCKYALLKHTPQSSSVKKTLSHALEQLNFNFRLNSKFPYTIPKPPQVRS